VRKAMPPPTVWVSTRRIGFLSLVSPKRRAPAPSTTGKIVSRSSSTRSLLDQHPGELGAAEDDEFPV
jgi:hypothetical protein